MIAPPALPRRHHPARHLLDQVLDPADRLVQGIYSVLIVLTFTLVTEIGVAPPTDRLWAEVLGAAVAWGLIDGIMYILACRLERGQWRRLPAALRRAATEDEGIAVIAGTLDEVLEPLADQETRRSIYRALYHQAHNPPPPVVSHTREDLFGAISVALIAIGAALPLVVPLLLFSDSPALAVRLSNLIAFALLFAMGYGWARYVGGRPVRTGLLLLLIGMGMVAIAIPLGG